MGIIGPNGHNWGDLDTFLDNTLAVCNELRTDHATNVTLLTELKADVSALTLAVDAICTKLDADAGITDTNYEAVHGSGGSGVAIPAAAVTASPPATLTAAALSKTI